MDNVFADGLVMNGHPLDTVAGIILAGGGNTRMNSPKAFLEVGGERIIDRQLKALGQVFGEVFIVAGQPGEYAGLGVRVVQDDESFRHIKSPLTGIYSGLLKAGCSRCFVVGCDMPFINPGLMRFMAGLAGRHDIVVPIAGGYAEPLFGVYSKTALGVLRSSLSGGVRRIGDVFGSLDVRYVPEDDLRRFDPGLYSIMNVNTPSDLARARQAADGMAACVQRAAGSAKVY